MSWARSFLKLPGYVENPKRGVWVLTDLGKAAAARSNNELKKVVYEAYKASLAVKKAAEEAGEPPAPSAKEGVAQERSTWTDKLMSKLQALHPSAFERLCQRILRESGFTRVEVTGKTGDGGIDGVGVLRMNLISFNVFFQCKRWKGSVGSEIIRNFRGAMQGRADKGLIITTGTFTSEARKEATRDGAPTIDLIDGDALCELLRDLKLGLQIKEIVSYEIMIEDDFFGSL